jgi:GntR family transcriptional regulator
MKISKEGLLSHVRLARTGVPRYVQLKNQLLALIADGTLEPGDQLPTMREMAEAIAIDVTTVKRCYDDLAAAGAVEVKRPSGTFVTGRPPPVSAGDDLPARTRALALQTLGDAAAQGIPARRLVDELNRLLAAQGDSATARDRSTSKR